MYIVENYIKELLNSQNVHINYLNLYSVTEDIYTFFELFTKKFIFINNL